MARKNWKRSAYFKPNGLRVNCDGTDIKDRKPDLRLKSNHFKSFKRHHRIWPAHLGQAVSDGQGWYKTP